jgi:molybdopterin synthase sulfur carrier subunit
MSSDAGQVTVWIPAPLRSLTAGQETVRVTGTTLRQILEALDRLYPGLKSRLCDANGLRPGVAVAVNTQVATLGLIQPVPQGSEVHFLPAISGGSQRPLDEKEGFHGRANQFPPPGCRHSREG